jgi:ribosomal protein S18 acetylase RimI-like enzyme
MIEIIPVESEEQVGYVVGLTQEYVTWMLAALQERFPALDIGEFTSEHTYDDIRQKFPGEHVPPFGRLYLAADGGRVGGCIALGRLSDSVCEMRTLYVRPAFRRTGMGRALVAKVLDDARAIGYAQMVLDTLPFMESALKLYRSLGFRDTAPYRDVSDALRRTICFLELDLHRTH